MKFGQANSQFLDGIAKLVVKPQCGFWRGQISISGRNTKINDDRPYKILWHGVNEPDKLKGIEGKIYILLQSIDRNGIIKDEPRLVQVSFDPLLYEKMEQIEKITKNGTPIAVRFTNLNIENFDNNLPSELSGDIDRYNSLSGDIDIKFEEIKGTSLPKK